MAAKTDKTVRDEKRRQKERLENKARGMIRAGANFDEIANNLGISPRKARQVAVSSLTRKARPTSEQQRKIDFEVLRGLALKLQKAAFEGDVAAARQFLDVQDRMAGLNVPGDDTLPLVEAFDKTVAACASEGLDADGRAKYPLKRPADFQIWVLKFRAWYCSSKVVRSASTGEAFPSIPSGDQPGKLKTWSAGISTDCGLSPVAAKKVLGAPKASISTVSHSLGSSRNSGCPSFPIVTHT